MAEVVQLEERRFNGFLTKFEELLEDICNETANLEEKECDDQMIARFNDVETDVILSVLPPTTMDCRNTQTTPDVVQLPGTGLQLRPRPNSRSRILQQLTSESPKSPGGA